MPKAITKCRICGNQNLVSLLHLGDQALTGVFPKTRETKVSSGPLELVKCHPKNEGEKVCHLVQLRHSYDSSEMYGMNYGYRSGLNASMVAHLRSVVQSIERFMKLQSGDLIIDIGSNDSTLLQQYSVKGLDRTGIDPTGVKFHTYYPPDIQLIPDFFSQENIQKKHPGRKAKVITSIAMFYDLEDPQSFVQQVHDVLDPEGIWVFEQSYMPLMLDTHSYDTICHEHVEYYALSQIKYMLSKAGMKILDVELNDVNGGSFKIMASHIGSSHSISPSVARLEAEEASRQLETLRPYEQFHQAVLRHKSELVALLKRLTSEGKSILGYGASTKGNVILQYCGLTNKDIPCIAEVNEDKFGSFTPFNYIPIISEKEARKMKPDYFLVLPWHFRKGILAKEKEFLDGGGQFIFPLPQIEIVRG